MVLLQGHWHREGLNENIAAVGVYYLEVGDMRGGALKLRSAGQVADPHYAVSREAVFFFVS